jgi:Ricin-type beta-trefoil lectin domain-like
MTIRRWWWLAVLVGVVGFGAARVAEAQSPPDMNKHYRIIAKHSNKCLDVQNYSMTNGARLWQWDCIPWVHLPQAFNITPTGTGAYRITALHSIKCVGISPYSSLPPNNPISDMANSATADQWDCNTSTVQLTQAFQFLAAVDAPGYFRIKPVHSGKCLDVLNASLNNGTLVHQWDCGAFAQDNQLWRLEEIGPRAPRTHIQQFGYFSQPQLTSRYHTSFVLVQSLAELDAVAAAGHKAYIRIWLFGQFFTTDWYAPAPLVHPYAQSFWGQFASQLTPQRLNAIAFFEVADEPFSTAPGRGYTGTEIKNALQTIAGWIKTSFPDKPVAIVEAPIGLNWFQAVPNVDWIGVGCYGAWNNCDGGGHSYPQVVASYEALMAPAQKVLIMPFAGIFRASGNNTPLSPAEIGDRLYQADRYVEYALTNPRTAAMMTWTASWTDVNGHRWYGPPSTDAPELAPLTAKYYFIGRALGFGQNMP